jgi:hypothetical protein
VTPPPLPSTSSDFRRVASLIALMMEAVQTSETSVKSYQSTGRYNPEDSHLLNKQCFVENEIKTNYCKKNKYSLPYQN